MPRSWIVQASVAFGLALSGYLGATATANSAAGPPAKAYVVSEIAAHDNKQYQAYLRQVLPLIHKHGGQVLVSPFGPKRVLEGRALEGRFAMLEFPSAEDRDAFWNSPEYEAVKPLRLESAKSRIIHVGE